MTSDFIDLSRRIQPVASCSYSTTNKVPAVSFEEGDANGIRFISSKIDNLHSNIATHVDLPGHIADRPSWLAPRVADIPLERFIGEAVIIDVSDLSITISDWFGQDGNFPVERVDEFETFLTDVAALEISTEILTGRLRACGVAEIADVDGILLHTGLGRHYRPGPHNAWSYAYFYSPYFSQGASRLIAQSGVKFVGSDSFQIEHPIINFAGDELPFMSNCKASSVRDHLLDEWKASTNHCVLLGAGVLIYENLQIDAESVGTRGTFHGVPLALDLPGVNDNALVRPYLNECRKLSP